MNRNQSDGVSGSLQNALNYFPHNFEAFADYDSQPISNRIVSLFLFTEKDPDNNLLNHCRHNTDYCAKHVHTLGCLHLISVLAHDWIGGGTAEKRTNKNAANTPYNFCFSYTIEARLWNNVVIDVRGFTSEYFISCISIAVLFYAIPDVLNVHGNQIASHSQMVK